VTGSIDARGVKPRQRPYRVVPVLLESLAVQNGHTAAPVVGEHAAVVLGFSESSGDVGEMGVAPTGPLDLTALLDGGRAPVIGG
jgi:hypothetical protein